MNVEAFNFLVSFYCSLVFDIFVVHLLSPFLLIMLFMKAESLPEDSLNDFLLILLQPEH